MVSGQTRQATATEKEMIRKIDKKREKLEGVNGANIDATVHIQCVMCT